MKKKKPLRTIKYFGIPSFESFSSSVKVIFANERFFVGRVLRYSRHPEETLFTILSERASRLNGIEAMSHGLSGASSF